MFPRILPVLLLCWSFACAPAEAPDAEPVAPALTDSLDAVARRIDRHELSAALVGARRLLPHVEDPGAAVPDTLRLRLYHYLAELHGKLWLSYDSITYYTRAAERLLPPDAAPVTRARQLYVRAYGRLAYDRTWVDVMMTSDLGLSLLERHGLTKHPLYAKLLLTRGIGSKYYGSGLTDTAARSAELARSLRFLGRAERQLAGAHPAWRREPWIEQGFVELRLRNPSPRVAALLDSIGSHDDAAVSTDSLFLQTIYDTYGRRAPEAYRNARALLAATHPDNYRYRSAGYYAVQEAALALRNYGAALHFTAESADAFGCCFADAWGRPCQNRRGCANYATAYTTILLGRYREQHRSPDLDTAYRLSQWALNRYEINFRNGQEESALNVMSVIGRRMLNNALDAAYAMQQLQPHPDRLQALLQTMERGKTLLLEGDLQASTSVEAGGATLRGLRSELEDRKLAYRMRGRSTPDELERYATISSAYERQSADVAGADGTGAFAHYARRPEELPTLSGVRRHLTPDQALLEFAETDRHLLALYVDRDTALAFRVPLGPTDTLCGAFLAGVRGSVGSRADTTGYYARARSLYHTLFAPVADVASRRRELLIVGSATVREVPFSALMDRPGRYLLDRWAVRYLPSWQVEEYMHPRRRPLTRPTVAAYTHPYLRGYFAPLTDYLATHTTLRRLPPGDDLSRTAGSDIVHLSIHARGNPDQLHGNYLYLTDRDSLNGLAVAGRSLTARLVVLAACATARGPSSAGEGTFSLQRSFHLAGVPDVISSLYDIPAEATAVLLTEFYRALLAGDSPTRALWRARIHLRHGRAGRRYASPGHWAGVILG